MRLLYIDTHGTSGGHHITYSGAIVREAIRRNWEVDFGVTKSALAHGGIVRVVGEVEQSGGMILDVPELPRLAGTPWRYWVGQVSRWKVVQKAWQAAHRAERPDFVYVVDCDGWLAAAALFGAPVDGVPYGSMTLQARVHRRERLCGRKEELRYRFDVEVLRRFIDRSRVSLLLCLEESLPDVIEKDTRQSGGKLKYIPDLGSAPTLIDRHSALKGLGADPSVQYICTFGISKRKGIPELIAALASEHCPQHIGAIVLGAADDHCGRLLRSEPVEKLKAQRRLIVREHYYSTNEQVLAMSASSAAWLGYKEFYGSSGVLCECAGAGLPILACNDGWIGSRTRQSNLGITVNTSDVAETCAALVQLVCKSDKREEFVKCCRREGRSHTREAFGSNVCNEIVEAERNNST